MRQLIRLKEGRTAKVKDIPGFLTQCIASKVGPTQTISGDLKTKDIRSSSRKSPKACNYYTSSCTAGVLSSSLAVGQGLPGTSFLMLSYEDVSRAFLSKIYIRTVYVFFFSLELLGSLESSYEIKPSLV
jgi:hypothetical protein